MWIIVLNALIVCIEDFTPQKQVPRLAEKDTIGQTICSRRGMVCLTILESGKLTNVINGTFETQCISLSSRIKLILLQYHACQWVARCQSNRADRILLQRNNCK